MADYHSIGRCEWTDFLTLLIISFFFHFFSFVSSRFILIERKCESQITNKFTCFQLNLTDPNGQNYHIEVCQTSHGHLLIFFYIKLQHFPILLQFRIYSDTKTIRCVRSRMTLHWFVCQVKLNLAPPFGQLASKPI